MRVLHIEVRDGDRRDTLTFTAFPVRIGRELPNECLLEFPFVSRNHARLEITDDGRLLLHDLGSRHGTRVLNGTRAVVRETAVDLASVDNEFQIGPLKLRVRLRELGPAGELRGEADLETATVDLKRSVSEQLTRGYDAVDPSEMDARAAVDQLGESLERYARLRAELRKQVHAVSDARFRAALLADYPELDAGAPAPASTRTQQAAVVALQGLRELAALYVPYAPPLHDAQAVATFYAKLAGVLTVFFDAFAALRMAYRTEAHLPYADAARRVDIGARMLDWTDTSDDARREIEAECVDMVMHHAALHDEVQRAIRHLFADLDPLEIERSTPGPFRGLRFRPRWAEFCRRYAAAREGLPRILGRRFSMLAKVLTIAADDASADVACPALDGLLPATV